MCHHQCSKGEQPLSFYGMLHDEHGMKYIVSEVAIIFLVFPHKKQLKQTRTSYLFRSDDSWTDTIPSSNHNPSQSRAPRPKVRVLSGTLSLPSWLYWRSYGCRYWLFWDYIIALFSTRHGVDNPASSSLSKPLLYALENTIIKTDFDPWRPT